MIKIVDYGLGNVRAFLNVYKSLNIPASAADTAEKLSGAERIILPGVGAFDQAMELLQASGMRETLDDLVLNKKTPILGVCVGMQILGSNSTEGRESGLNWIEGEVRSLTRTTNQDGLYLPHMGWNDVYPLNGSSIFSGLEDGARFYFLHSYYFDCSHETTRLAETDYGTRFTSAVQRENVYGVQFHPEKSHKFGSTLLENFARV